MKYFLIMWEHVVVMLAFFKIYLGNICDGMISEQFLDHSGSILRSSEDNFRIIWDHLRTRFLFLLAPGLKDQIRMTRKVSMVMFLRH